MNREERRLLAYRIACTPDPPQPAKYLYACAARCPGGNECCLSHDVYHVLHCCDSPSCYCHSKERFEEKK